MVVLSLVGFAWNRVKICVGTSIRNKVGNETLNSLYF